MSDTVYKTSSVRLDGFVESLLEHTTRVADLSRSEVIREAIVSYARSHLPPELWVATVNQHGNMALEFVRLERLREAFPREFGAIVRILRSRATTSPPAHGEPQPSIHPPQYGSPTISTPNGTGSMGMGEYR